MLKDRYIIGIALTGLILMFSRYFWGYPGYMAYFSDDFYYYLKIAENFVEYGNSSFNNIYQTNGYHPLYFLFLSLGYFLTQFNQSLIFIFVSVSAVISTVLTYILTVKITSNFITDKNYRIMIAIFVSWVSALIMKGGMEVILTIPLLLLFIFYSIEKGILDKKQSIIFGLISSMLILSRLDAGFFVAISVIFILFNSKFKQIKLLYYLLGCLPLIMYLGINIIYFDTLVPVSGLAKQLKSDYIPALKTIQSVFVFTANGFIYTIIPAIMNLTSIILFFYNFKNIAQKHLTFVIPALIFPIILILYYSIFSGWEFWAWYFYIFIPSIIVFFIFSEKYLIKIITKRFNIIFLFFILIFSLLFAFTKRPTDYEEFNLALKIEQFEKNHKGIYAMGDRAGLAGYLIESPLIQTEGLVMDKEFITAIKTLNLNDLLNKYKVDYFISRNPLRAKELWYVEEPQNHCGKNITSKGVLYIQPIDSIIINRWKSFIFKLK